MLLDIPALGCCSVGARRARDWASWSTQAQAGNLIFGMLELTFETQQGLHEISLGNVIKFHAHTHTESISPNFYKRRELVPRVCTFAAGHFVVLLSWQPLESPVFYLRKRTDPLQKVPMVILVAHVDSVV